MTFWHKPKTEQGSSSYKWTKPKSKKLFDVLECWTATWRPAGSVSNILYSIYSYSTMPYPTVLFIHFALSYLSSHDCKKVLNPRQHLGVFNAEPSRPKSNHSVCTQKDTLKQQKKNRQIEPKIEQTSERSPECTDLNFLHSGDPSWLAPSWEGELKLNFHPGILSLLPTKKERTKKERTNFSQNPILWMKNKGFEIIRR